ncbi:hypothetical protein GGI04_003653 [Coemansia thaxteri]|uniref:Uncharacterized protein n=1 Tax=Coemansia thaxteri TaxID=2663907 RepID=A0A9W8BEL1_9FUNG|nr:hypothetical protein H4R26_005237 [Coemansia thaxteri]KAJ2001662.1 hypothetical protein GGI04_003653 [Coemansia thaxteri]KAJ2467532.1 hypothetical protein GGI02_004006 [Coemansia sp. RSA 2322]KAJ2483722.1 hypothetical protein EV174_002870 [Coemansia sp. RSA 2320]
MQATVVPAKSRFGVHTSEYALDPVSCTPTRLAANSSAGHNGDMSASYINILVMAHRGSGGGPGMVWVWGQVSRGRRAQTAVMSNLALAMPPASVCMRRASASQLLGAGAADDPTADIARRLSSRFKQPIYLSLSNVSTSRLTAPAAGPSASLALSMSQADELGALEACLVAELTQALALQQAGNPKTAPAAA